MNATAPAAGGVAGRRSRARSRLVALALGLGAAFAGLVGPGAPPASAHAVLLSTTPADRAALDEAPSEVVLEFSEPVSASLGGVRAFDAAGERVDEGELDATGAVLRLGLRAGLGDGAYVVTYRILSQDGHPITGAFTFTVGDAEAASDAAVRGLLGSDDDSTWDIAGGVARALGYLGALGAAGLGAFLVLAHDGGAEAPRLRRWLVVLAGVGAGGVLLALPIAAARLTGLGLGAILEEGVLGDILGEGVGVSTAVVVSGLAVLAVGRGRWRPLALVGAVAATAGFALAGHTATADPRIPAVVSDAVHALAAAVWFGGLLGMVAVLRSRRGDDAATAAPVVSRFSSLAGLSLLAVAAGGLFLGWREVRELDALTSTTYGKVLLTKVAVVGAVAAMAAWNRFRLVPAMEAAPKRAADRLRRTVQLEAAGLLVAIGFTAALVNITPAYASAGIGQIFSDTVAFGDGSVNVVVDPNRAGTNVIHLYVYDDAGRVSTQEFDEVVMRLTLPSAEIGPLERTPFVAGAGHYQLDGGDLSIAGTWTIEVVARVDTFDQVTATVDVAVNP